MDKLSYLSNADPAMIDELYSQYRRDASTVDDGWRRFFEGFEFSQTHYDGHYEEQHKDEPCENYPCEFKVFNLINGYRERGHLFTKTNPVRTRRQYRPTLDLENFGLTSDDLDRKFAAGNEIEIGRAHV